MRLAIASLCIVALSTVFGCSPYLYSPEIKNFSSGVSDVAAYRTTLLQGEQVDRNRRDQVIGTVEGRTRYQAQNCDLLKDEIGHCQVADMVQQERETKQREKAQALLASKETAPSTSPSSPTPAAAATESSDVCLAPPGSAELASAKISPLTAEQQQDRIFTALAKYADALTAITNAADRQAFDTASTQLASSASALAGVLATAAGPAGLAVGPLTLAAVKLATHIEGTVLDQRRYDTLRNSVVGACIPVRILSAAAGLVLSNHRVHRLTDDQQTQEALLSPRGGRYGDLRTRLSVGQDTAAAIESLRKDPLDTTQNIRRLHDKLVIDIVSNKGQSLAFINELGAFADDAKALRDAASQAPTAASSKTASK